MLAIYLKEIKAFLRSLSGWIFLAVMTFFASISIMSNNFFGKNPYISWTIGGFVMIPLFVIPLITMRAYAGERRQKTDQLLLTSPLSIAEIVLGKFFALITMAFATSIIFLIAMGLMSIYGEVPLVENLLAIVAYFLYCCICIAIGLFLSSLTDNLIIAAVMTYAVYLIVVMVPSVVSAIFPDSWPSKIISALDYIDRFTSLFNGMIHLSDLLYIFSVIVIFLLLTYLSVGRYSLRFKSGNKKSLTGHAIICIAIVLLFAINVVVKYLPIGDVQFDWTQRQLYSISDETEELLDTLTEDVYIYVIGDEKAVDQAVTLYTADYERHSSKIKVEFKSESKDPFFYTTYTDEQLPVSSMIVTYGDKSRIVNYSDCYEYQYINGQYTQTGVDIEGQITAAINSMVYGQEIVVYELVGHSEIGLLEQSVVSRMLKGGYQHGTLNLMDVNTIPDDAECIIVAGPQYDLTEAEIAELKRFSEAGGDLILFASDPSCDTSNYNAFIESYGVTLVHDYICDTDYTKVFQGYPHYLWADRQSHSYTSALDADRMNLFPQSCGFIIHKDENSDIAVGSLFESSENSITAIEYGVITGSLSADEVTEEQPQGPFSLAFLATDKNEVQGATVVFGSPYLLLSSVDAQCASANSELFLSILGRLVDMEMNSTVPVKSFAYQAVVVPTTMMLLFGFLLVLLVPLGLFVAGIVISLIRRRK